MTIFLYVVLYLIFCGVVGYFTLVKRVNKNLPGQVSRVYVLLSWLTIFAVPGMFLFLIIISLVFYIKGQFGETL